MAYYGYDPISFVPQRSPVAEFLQTAALTLGQLPGKIKQQKKIEARESLELQERKDRLKALKKDKATARDLWSKTTDQAAQQLRDAGWADEGAINKKVHSMYIPPMESETPTQSINRIVKSNDNFKAFVDKERTKHQTRKAHEEIATIGVQEREYGAPTAAPEQQAALAEQGLFTGEIQPPRTISTGMPVTSAEAKGVAAQYPQEVQKALEPTITGMQEAETMRKAGAISQFGAMPGATREVATQLIGGQIEGVEKLIQNIPTKLQLEEASLKQKKAFQDAQDRAQDLRDEERKRYEGNLKYLQTQAKNAANEIRVLTKEMPDPAQLKTQGGYSQDNIDLAMRIGDAQAKERQVLAQVEKLKQNPAMPLSEIMQSIGFAGHEVPPEEKYGYANWTEPQWDNFARQELSKMGNTNPTPQHIETLKAALKSRLIQQPAVTQATPEELEEMRTPQTPAPAAPAPIGVMGGGRSGRMY